MRQCAFFLFALAVTMLSAQSVGAQDISGDWQGTLKSSSQAPALRLVVHMTKTGDGGWTGMFYSIDQAPEGLDGAAVTSLTLQGSSFKFSIDPLHASFEGQLSSDGNSITGTWAGRR